MGLKSFIAFWLVSKTFSGEVVKWRSEVANPWGMSSLPVSPVQLKYYLASKAMKGRPPL